MTADPVLINSPDMDVEITLGLLTAVERDETLTQRRVASELGIAVGMVNIYLKRCIAKGLLKVQQAPANRYLYYLTPAGFVEKSMLTASFVRNSFNLFRDARIQYAGLFDECAGRKYRSLGLMGRSELAEIAFLSGRERNVPISALIDDDVSMAFFDLPVWSCAKIPNTVDAVVITALVDAQAYYDRACGIWGVDRVLAPPLLRITPGKSEVAGL